MTAVDDVEHRLQELKFRIEQEIAELRRTRTQIMPDDVWDDERRRLEWIREDSAQMKYVGDRLSRLKRLYDRCFPNPDWVVFEIESFYEKEEGPLY